MHFCTDPRFDEDTLFIIFEEDYRFTPDAGDPAWTHEKRRDTSSTIPPSLVPSPPPAEQASSSSAPSASLDTTAEPGRVEPTAHPEKGLRQNRAAAADYVLPSKAPAEAFKQPSMFLRDLVAYATLADRQKRGNFIFCGWQPHGAGESASCKEKDNYRSGLMLSMVSQYAFFALETAFRDDHIPKGHVDLGIKKYLSQPQISFGSYITPPLGGYTAHLSGCEKEFFDKPRPCIWMEAFACPGTRKVHDWNEKPRDKWLCTFTAKGKRDYVCRLDVDVPDEKVRWTTFDSRHGDVGAAKSYAGWGSAAWDADTKDWVERTERQLRSGRQLRQREKFRCWIASEEVGVKT